MKDSSASPHAQETRNRREVAGLLDAQARDLMPPSRDERLTRRIMQRVVGTQRALTEPTTERWKFVSPLWLGAAATAAALVLAVLILPDQSDPSENFRFQIPAPAQLDRPLAAREQAMSTELEQIGADLHQLARLASIRLESNSG